MRKVLMALFAVMILGIGVIGYKVMDSEPNEVIEERDLHRDPTLMI